MAKRVVQNLSVHSTLAVFQGIENARCFFRTALCPNRCGHGGPTAIFEISKYYEYQKIGEYGDEKQKNFRVKLSDPDVKPFVDKINGLTKGQKVKLNWSHDYVTTTYVENGEEYSASTPERPITLLELFEN